MGRVVQIVLEVDNRGQARIREFGDSLSDAAKRGAAGAGQAFGTFETEIGQRIDRVTRRFMAWGTLAAGLLGGVVTRAIVNLGTEFDRVMSSVGALTGATGQEFDALRQKAIELGAATVFTASDAAEAMERLSQAGFKTNQILDVTGDVMALAAAGTLDMANAAEIATDVLYQFELGAGDFKRAGDALVFAATNSKQRVQDLGTAFSYAGTLAHQLGMTVEETAAAFMALANAGIPAERAGTGLTRVLAVLMGDLEEGEKGLAGFGLKLFDAEGRFVGLTEAMRRMRDAGLSTQDVWEAFGARGGPAALALFQSGAEKIEGFTAALEKSGGTMDRIADEKLDNVWGATEELKGALESLGLTIFREVEPGLRGMVEGATDVVRAWGELMQTTDVWAGVERVAKAAAAAITLLSISAGVKLVASLRSATLAVVTYTTGLHAAEIQTLATMTATEAWIVTSTRAKVAMAGLVAGFAAIGWQIGRTLGELTGLDAVVERFFSKAINRDPETAFQVLRSDVEFLERALPRLGSAGVTLDVAGPLAEAKKELTNFEVYANEKGKVKIEANTRELREGIAGARNAVQEIARELRQRPAEFKAAWDQAAEGTDTFAERLKKAQEILATVKPPEGLSRIGTDAGEEAKKVEEATKDLAKALLETGRLTAPMVATFQEDFGRLAKIAEAQRVPLSAVASAYREDLLAIGQAAKDSEVPLGSFLDELVRLAASSTDVKARFELDLGALDEAEETVAGFGLATARTVDEFVQHAARLQAAAKTSGSDVSLVWRALAEDAEELRKAIVASGGEIPLALQQILQQTERFKGLDLGRRAWEELKGAMAGANVVAGVTLQDLEKRYRIMGQAALDHGVSLRQVAQANREDLIAWGDAAKVAGVQLAPFLQELVDLANLDLRAANWRELTREIHGLGIATAESVKLFQEDLTKALADGAEHGLTSAEVFRTMRDAIVEAHNAAVAAGEEIPTVLAEAFDTVQASEFSETLRAGALEFVTSIRSAWAGFVQGGISSFATMVGQVATGAVKLGEAFKNLLKQGAAEAIAMLVKWGIQRLILAKLTAKATAGEHSAQLSGSLASVYANAFASTAAIPIIGPALAPAAAAAALAVATAGAGTAAATGAGLGAAIGAAAVIPGSAEGSLVTQPQVVSVGEFGRPEAIVPLEGAAADRTRRALGLDQGGAGASISLTYQHHGAILSEEVPRSFVRQVADELVSLIRLGRIEPLPLGARS